MAYKDDAVTVQSRNLPLLPSLRKLAGHHPVHGVSLCMEYHCVWNITIYMEHHPLEGSSQLVALGNDFSVPCLNHRYMMNDIGSTRAGAREGSQQPGVTFDRSQDGVVLYMLYYHVWCINIHGCYYKWRFHLPLLPGSGKCEISNSVDRTQNFPISGGVLSTSL